MADVSVADSGTSTTSSPIKPVEKSVVIDDSPKPVQIIIRDSQDKHKFHLNDEQLKKILTKDPDTKNLPIAVLSVAGAFRKGKSFFINLLMNYLKKNALTTDIPMLFSWRGGATRDTTGILAWPELFKLTTTEGKNFALLIMDTQGTFDDESSVRDNATIFALSCMTSSKVVYNLSQQIQEDDLQHLELFTNYGELALENGQSKPFQQLSFLVRDWQFPYEFAYGRDTLKEADEDGVTQSGQVYLNKKLLVKEDTHEDLANVRQHIRDCFMKTDCFLMPHPGLKVAQSPKFNGQISMIEPEFIEHTDKMFKTILSEIKPKLVDGKEITSSQLLHFFQTYATVFDSQDLPEPKNLLQATAEATLLGLLTDIKMSFEKKMSLKMQDQALNTREFTLTAETETGMALTKFDSTKKLGSDEIIEKFRNSLDEHLTNQISRFKEQNDNKRMATSWRTPATLLVTNILAQIIRFILGMLFLGPFAAVFTVVLYIGWLLMGVWCWTAYSDTYAILRERIDEIAEQLATKVLGVGLRVVQEQAGNPMVNTVLDRARVVVDTMTSSGATGGSESSSGSRKKED